MNAGDNDGAGKDGEPSSPVCYIRETDPAYMGYASRDELIAFLNELLEAERAIAQKLRGMLPKVRDDALHGDLKTMLARSEENMAKIDSLLTQQSNLKSS
jgi:hypothetical protein